MSARVLAESALRVSDCVTELLRKQPFFGSLVLRLPLRPDATRETLATDGHEIRYSPQWVAKTASHLIETAMARVVMACALKHHTRRGERDPERWQRASQLVTHALIRDAGFTLPPAAQAWDGMSAEEAYERLSERADDDAGDDASASPDAGAAGAGAAEAGETASDTDDDDTGDPSDSADDGDRRDEDGDGDDSDGQGEDRDGEREDADDQAGEDTSDAPPSHEPSGTGEVMDAHTRAGDDGEAAEAPLDVTAEEQTWDEEAMHQALNIARAEGKLPGRVEETIRSAHVSTLDWRTLLRRYMTDAASHDYSWSVPNRRFIDSGLYLPSIRSEGIETIVFIIDISSSLPTTTLAEFWAELREVAAEIGPESVIVLQVDTMLQDVAEYAADDLPEEIAIKGRGGTDFRPGFAWLDQQGMQPGVCLYFTDMECSDYPEHEPAFPVAWVDYGDGDSPWRHPAPWGEHIRIAA
ncbi:MAG: VWA-like domain-containing protein [Alphaproteobacteria bacterium]|nr:VWA-like domain-containing protein [Alphaproteobacteria bacterium]